jgi:Ca2+-transporting ATPase
MSPTSSSNPTAVWHTLDTNQVLDTLKSDRRSGLTPQEVAKRLEKYGANELEEAPGRGALAIIWDQFKNIMLLMLIVVAIVSAVLDLRGGRFPKDAIAILLIVVLNAVLGYLQESRAEKALAALKRMASPLVRVVRQDKIMEVPAKEIVPGDVILLEAGVQIPADG